ncbi:class I SAM-dependent methyltransferase [Delftia lacustris]|uniref:class I SAM-dependent methyltransferase n=1 Tax=Delftia lacustris TaxID=558537 RepID=UPI00286059CF|nr:class I SAM-dependent methyltransferase [Delftia lacustris]MDR6728445.1 2-polyprenyl-3-methyl-5-hydroxy-6-metoxy-1,4-benzoquinol methylase [Delftia lacustris]
MISDEEITAAHWSKNVASSDAFSPQLYWLAIPAVQRRFQRKACAGTRHEWWGTYCMEEFFDRPRSSAKMLSIGCGSGSLERELFRLNAFGEFDAIDIASGAIDIARAEARSMGADNINYFVRDVQSVPLGSGIYDAVWFNGSLHHIKHLELVCQSVRAALKPGGWVFFNEYVGANQFAFNEFQRTVISSAFQLLPPAYRRSFQVEHFGKVQHTVQLPDPIEVARVDPSEAIRSQDIRKVLSENFVECAFNPCGGNILQFALHGIAGNFVESNPRSMALLEMLFQIEDALISNSFLESDFAVGVMRAP